MILQAQRVKPCHFLERKLNYLFKRLYTNNEALQIYMALLEALYLSAKSLFIHNNNSSFSLLASGLLALRQTLYSCSEVKE